MKVGDSMSELVNGKIPAGSECPYTKQCPYKENGECKHRGVNHTVPYSCGTARLFQIKFWR